MAITQANRRFMVTTPLEEDALVLRRMSGSEQLSGLFEFNLELYSDDIDIKHEDLLGENITVAIDLLHGEMIRYINGVVSRISIDGCNDRQVVYRVTLRPWFWLLTRTNNCRIFQELTVPDIIKEVFGGHGFSDFEDRLTGDYRTWEYCVQYRESDFNFISRLMEQEGIYYFFEHVDGKHTLVMADAPSAHETNPGYETIPYLPPDEHNHRTRDHLQRWSASKQIQSGAYALTDYDFKAPKKSLASVAEVAREHISSEFEVFDYPGEYLESSEGEQYVKARIQEIQVQHEIFQGEGDAAGLSAGSVFELTGFPREDQNRKYLILNAHYSISSSGLVGGQSGETEKFCINIQAMDAEQSFRAPRRAIKPIVQGPQTAIIVGAAGEEVYIDEYGRVKVQFHWDRYGEFDENSSCWIRVSQVWAGKNWGGIFTPRIGQEVIVDFLEGDPDRPIITGRVYNNDQMPPYDLPANKTQSGIKSNSSLGGEGFNEIRFEDKKGEEEFYIHGEKDQLIEINNDSTETIGNDLVLTVDGNVTETFNANHSMAVTDDSTITGTNITIEASNSITLVVGGSSITLEAGGITIASGGNVDVEAGGIATLKGSVVNIN